MFGRAPDPKKLAKRRFRIAQSDQHNPFYNLSLEESLFSDYQPGASSGEEVMLLYINSASVVLGKHQNPWKECDLLWLFEQNIPLLRRFSGGGTVFHDLGNLLWSFIGPQKNFSQEENLLIIRQAIASYSGLPLDDFSLSPRGDIFCRGFKISGNALAFSADKFLHHGTLLVNSDIDVLNRSLKGLDYFFSLKFEGPSVESPPATVASLSSIITPASQAGRPANSDGLSQKNLKEDFYLALKESLGQNHCVFREEDEARAADIWQTRHASSEWRIRRTPSFRILLKNGQRISVNKGLAAMKESTADTRTWDLANPVELRSFKAHLCRLEKN